MPFDPGSPIFSSTGLQPPELSIQTPISPIFGSYLYITSLVVELKIRLLLNHTGPSVQPNSVLSLGLECLSKLIIFNLKFSKIFNH
eukprot:UN18892